MEKRLHMDQLGALLAAGAKGCQDVATLLRDTVRGHVSERIAIQGVPQTQ